MLSILRAHTAPYLPLALLAVILSALMVEPAAAQSLGGVETVLQSVVDLLTGNVARLIGIIAVVFIGLAWAFGYADMRTAGMTVLGLVIVFSAAEVVDLLAGS